MPQRLRHAVGGYVYHVLNRAVDAATGRELLNLRGHTGRVNSVAFSGDGTRLASASQDKTVKVWDLSAK